MAHKDWCGKRCAECLHSCSLDESIPCSPDCSNLGLDGNPIDPILCKVVGCDSMDDDASNNDLSAVSK